MQKVAGEVVWIELHTLSRGPSPRTSGIDRNHVAALVEAGGQWPPILVNRADGRVIDGHHRLEAARILGWRTIQAIHFDGDTAGAYVEAVRRNVEHGLPLTMGERRTAVQHLLEQHRDWSDRRIAQVCALSPRTVGRLREAVYGATGPAFRIGRDGRDRPPAPKLNRLRIVEAVRSNPDASLRVIAQAVGASPETVRRIRQDLGEQSDMVAPTDRAGTPEPTSLKPAPALSDDKALTATSQGQTFARWFEHSDPGTDWHAYAGALPPNRKFETASEARRRSLAWDEFAMLLEDRCRPPRAM